MKKTTLEMAIGIAQANNVPMDCGNGDITVYVNEPRNLIIPMDEAVWYYSKAKKAIVPASTQDERRIIVKPFGEYDKSVIYDYD